MDYIGLTTVLENNKIANGVFKMVLQGEVIKTNSNPGQFVNVQVKGHFLKRPISIHNLEDDKLTIIYKTFGKGTKTLSTYKKGDEVELLCDLGNGFNLAKVNEGQTAMLVGGGVGIPPLYLLAKELIKKNVKVEVVIGANSKEDLFCIEDFKAIGANVSISTVNGEEGTKGFVTDAIKENNIEFNYYYACGPMGMLEALHANYPTNGELSFEERMACGFGACMGCVCETKRAPYKRICADGPVFEVEEVIFDAK